jgi:hypothetical protein
MRRLRAGKLFGLGLAAVLLLAAGAAGRPRWPMLRPVAWLGLGLAVLLLGWLGRPRPGRRGWVPGLGTFALAGSLGLAYAAWGGTLLAWSALPTGWGALAALDGIWEIALRPGRRRAVRWIGRLGLAAVAGLVPVALVQVETHFAQEEFFALVQALVLAGVAFLLLSLSAGVRSRRAPGGKSGADAELCANADLRAVALLAAVLLAGGLAWLGARTLAAYRASFAPAEAPGYPGITAGSPFLCGQVLPAGGQSRSFAPTGQAVYERALDQVALWPDPGPLELAVLALGSGDSTQAEAFRQALLAEARAGAFTGAAHSVKSQQYDAALRIYFTGLLRQAFPSLFSPDEEATLRAWFAAIDERAWRTEGVDLLYALAFGPPDGPYENQEIGAGLLALLENGGWAAPELSAVNRAYLARSGGGWATHFRNPDDAYLYQAVWINNAFFQGLSQSPASLSPAEEENRRLAFEWLLLQALPDGAPLSYDHPARPPLVATWYQAARLLDDPRYVWLADRALSQVEQAGTGLQGNPGLEGPVSLAGRSPTAGSCLLYGDSGLPLQPGPLAPDKIVLRDGWQPDSTYLALNLRFSGWHRYKASNGMILLYQAGPLVVEGGSGQPVSWLPLGRQAFRDKRIAREDLNGLLIPRDGLDAALQALTGQGSSWAQDPPPYAGVQAFETLGPLDVSRTVLQDWHGWSHSRSIYFIHGGPLVVVDDAASQPARPGAALIWHLAGEARREGDGLWLREGENPARLVLPAAAWATTALQPAAQGGGNGPAVLYSSPQKGQLHLATGFLTGDWAAADFEARTLAGGTGQIIQVVGPASELRILHNASAGWLEAGGLGTDGLALVSWQPAGGGGWLCYVGASRIQVGESQTLTLDAHNSSGCTSWEALDKGDTG